MAKAKQKTGYQTRNAREAEKEAEQISWSLPPYSKAGVEAKEGKGRGRKKRKGR